MLVLRDLLCKVPDFERQVRMQAGITTVMPFARDENFVGREDIIKAINERFSRSKTFRRVALEGLGGIGYVM